MTPVTKMNIVWISLAMAMAPAAQGHADPLLDGLKAYHRGDYTAAEFSLRAALKSGDEPRARAFLLMTLAATGRCQEAVPGLSGLAGGGSEPEIARLSGIALAQCHLAAGETEQAWPVLRDLRARFPQDADVLYLTARLHNRGWNDAVYQLYRTNAASYRVNQMSGEVLEMQGQFVEAALEYQKAIVKNPKALNLHFRRGRALLMASQGEEALKAALQEFDAELALNPLDAVAEFQAAQVLGVLRRPEELEKRMARALEMKPDFPEALIALGKVRIEQRRNEEAISLLRKAVALVPASEPAHYNLMMAYRNAGRLQEARREKAELDRLQKPPEGEFSDFLKRLGEKPPQ